MTVKLIERACTVFFPGRLEDIQVNASHNRLSEIVDQAIDKRDFTYVGMAFAGFAAGTAVFIDEGKATTASVVALFYTLISLKEAYDALSIFNSYIELCEEIAQEENL